MTSNAAGNVIQGTFVGTDASGANPLPNNQAGVSIDGAANNIVGGPGGPGNFISFNLTNDVQLFSAGANGNKIELNQIRGSTTATTVGISVGIFAESPGLTGNTLSQNSISGHSGLGIDLAPAGVNQNQPEGANNYPVISSAQVANGTTTISGTLNSVSNAKFAIEFFSSASCNASGHGEGTVFVGAITLTPNADGNAAFNFSTVGQPVGSVITATSTDASGTTSEFSACTTVTTPAALGLVVTP